MPLRFRQRVAHQTVAPAARAGHKDKSVMRMLRMGADASDLSFCYFVGESSDPRLIHPERRDG
jgi:hypothetical protein